MREQCVCVCVCVCVVEGAGAARHLDTGCAFCIYTCIYASIACLHSGFRLQRSGRARNARALTSLLPHARAHTQMVLVERWRASRRETPGSVVLCARHTAQRARLQVPSRLLWRKFLRLISVSSQKNRVMTSPPRRFQKLPSGSEEVRRR